MVFKIKRLKFSHHVFVQQDSGSLRIKISGLYGGYPMVSPSPLLFARILLVQWGIHLAALKNKCISADTFQVVYLADSLFISSSKSCLLVKGVDAAHDQKIFKHGKNIFRKNSP